MPWRRRPVCSSGKTRLICFSVGAAVLAGFTACLLGGLMHGKLSPLLHQYARYKQVSASYSKEDIRKAMEKLKAGGR